MPPSSSNSLNLPEHHLQPPPPRPHSASTSANSSRNNKRKEDPLCNFIVPPPLVDTCIICPHLEAYLPTFLDSTDINGLSKFTQSNDKNKNDNHSSPSSYANSKKTSTRLMSQVHLKSLLDSNDDNDNIMNKNTKEEMNVQMALTKVENWLESVRANRHRYWKLEENKSERREEHGLHCKYCIKKKDPKKSSSFETIAPQSTTTNWMLDNNDLLMECLDCSLIGCGPSSSLHNNKKQKVNNTDSNQQQQNQNHHNTTKQHLIQHFLISGHTLGMTCGKNGYIYCSKCGKFVHNQVLEREKSRVNVLMNAKWLGWDRSRITQRSYGFSHRPMDDFFYVPTSLDTNGSTSANEANKELIIGKGKVVWRGFRALYPTDVPHAFIDAGQKTYQRIHYFRELLMQDEMKDSIICPIGLYNMGNTCYLSCVLQCVMNLIPFQQYFLNEVKHDHSSCKILRSHLTHKKKNKGDSSNSNNESKSICIGCEIDKLLVEYYGNVHGLNMIAALNDINKCSSNNINDIVRTEKGLPIAPTNLLVQLWKCKGMSLLAGYEQRDAHEFLQVFLDILSKDCRQFHTRANKIREETSLNEGFKCQKVSDPDKNDGDIASSFQGYLRSVLICTSCGFKRAQKEAFLNISIPLDKEFASQDDPTADSSTHSRTRKLHLTACLEHFVSPESLSEPVECPWCKSKTSTLKQHTFSKLPEVLCLHLKRFDAARNRKIDDLVSFPRELNMGAYMPHW